MSKYVKAITWDFLFDNMYEVYIPKKREKTVKGNPVAYQYYKRVRRKRTPKEDIRITKDICTLMQDGYDYKEACRYCVPHFMRKNELQSERVCRAFVNEANRNNERVGDTIMSFVKTFEKILDAKYNIDEADKVRLKEFAPEIGDEPTKTEVLVSNYIENTINKPNIKDIEMIMRIVGEGECFSTKEKIEVSETTNSVIKMLEETEWKEPEDITTPNGE